MSEQGVVSGGSRPPSTARGRGKPVVNPRPGISCNDCRKPMVTDGFITLCDCFFCETCAEKHFTNDNVCPCCKVSLPEGAIFGVNLNNPPSEDTLYASMQVMFSKDSKDSGQMFFDAMANNLVKKLKNITKETQFLLKQMNRETRKQMRSSFEGRETLKRMRREYEKMKQNMKAQESEFNAANEKRDSREMAFQRKIEECQTVLEEKDNMLQQFRNHCGTMTVRSPREREGRAPGDDGNRKPLGERRYKPPSQGLLETRGDNKCASMIAPSQQPRIPMLRPNSYSSAARVSGAIVDDQYSAGSGRSSSRGNVGQLDHSPMTAKGIRPNLHETAFRFGGRSDAHINKRRRQMSYNDGHFSAQQRPDPQTFPPRTNWT